MALSSIMTRKIAENFHYFKGSGATGMLCDYTFKKSFILYCMKIPNAATLREKTATASKKHAGCAIAFKAMIRKFSDVVWLPITIAGKPGLRYAQSVL